VDIDAEMGLASRFGIMSIPTILIFKDGKLVNQTVGVQPESVFAQMLDAALEN
jgi:thioredoxin 1